MVHMTIRPIILLALGAIALAAGCSGNPVNLLPHGSGGHPTSGPAHSPNPTPTPTPNGGPTMTVSAVETALINVQASFQNLPHTNLANDLNTLAAQMVSSRAYRSAVVNPGGIAARLPDGTRVLVFADRAEDLGGASPSARYRAPAAARPLDAPLSGPNAHEIALLVNERDTSGAFTPPRQFAFGNAFTQSGFGSSTGYGVDAVDMSLENLVALGTGHPLDYFDISTHGMIGSDPSMPLATNTFYAWLSTTLPTPALITQFQSDYNAGNLLSAIYLTLNKQTVPLDTLGFAFTPTFLTEHVHFNPGAIVDNESCWGQSPIIASNVQGVLQAAGVGRYLGWTKEVDGTDADETEGFLFDRLLGEQSPSITGLDGFANQRTPPQRPFPLDDIETAMGAETRNSPIRPGATAEPYTLSDKHFAINASAPPVADGTAARLIITDFGGENVADPPIEYSLPSISLMFVAETQANGALTIDGSFPAASGHIQITDSSGTTALAPTSWSTSQVTAMLPNGGNGSSGIVQVFFGTPGSGSVNIIASNPVPLTQWSGKLVYNESDQLPDLGGDQGSGTGTLQVTYDPINVRADVHPTVPQIDFSPEPQNFTFTGPEGNSRATVTALSGTFTTVDEGTPPPTMFHATFALAQNASQMVPGLPSGTGVPPGTFDIGAFGGQPAPCNNARAGPQGGPGNVFCPVAAFNSVDTGMCSDDDSGALCGPSVLSPSVNFGLPPGVGHVGGQLILTMDPATYAITVSSNQATFMSSHFNGGIPFDRSATASMTGSFSAPLSPPTGATPALRRANRSIVTNASAPRPH
jgi:hypothetical protein